MFAVLAGAPTPHKARFEARISFDLPRLSVEVMRELPRRGCKSKSCGSESVMRGPYFLRQSMGHSAYSGKEKRDEKVKNIEMAQAEYFERYSVHRTGDPVSSGRPRNLQHPTEIAY